MSTNSVNQAFEDLYKDIKIIEERDSTMTAAFQIQRLNRPGSSYFNLNPFDVLQVDPDTAIDQIKKKFRQLSILVHPDKNPDNPKAQIAFDALNKAYKTLQDDAGVEHCQKIVEQAKELVAKEMEEKRRIRGKNCALSTYVIIEEDDPDKYRSAVYVQTCKIFADLERLRVDEECKRQMERKRKIDEEQFTKEREEEKKEWEKNYEDSRDSRVESWRKFAKIASSSSSSSSAGATAQGENVILNANAAKKKKKEKKLSYGFGFRPPKTKMETRLEHQIQSGNQSGGPKSSK